jgi:hypothetical protein
LSPDTLSMRADPDPRSVALARVFVGNVLSAFGSDEDEAQDVKVVVSDLATGLVEAGRPIEISASFSRRELRLSGNMATGASAVSAPLLGSRLDMGEGHWTIDLSAT